MLRQIQANPVVVTLKSQRSFPGPAPLFPLASDHRTVRGRILGHAVIFEQAGPRTVIVKTGSKGEFSDLGADFLAQIDPCSMPALRLLHRPVSQLGLAHERFGWHLDPSGVPVRINEYGFAP